MSAAGESRANGFTDQEAGSRSTLKVGVLIGAFVLIWTVYPAFTRINLDQYGDMLENYAWGIGWQWGYFKHPPFFAWTTAAWFEIFPRVDWAYYLLSAANAGLAIFLSWRIATRFLDPWRSFLATALFFFLPPVTFLATKFNANSALLPLWPLVVLFYFRFLEKKKLSDAIILGLVAAVAMLTKYFSAVLLASVVLHIFADREARKLLALPATWIAALVFLAAMAPHVFWLVETDFLPINYAASQGDGSFLEGVTSGLRFVGAIVLYALPMAIILYVTLVRNRSGKSRLLDRSGMSSFTRTVAGRALLWTTFGSVALAVIAGIAFGTRLSSVWALPMFFAAPIFLVAFAGRDALETKREVLPLTVAIYCAGLLLAIPVVHYLDAGEKHYSHTPIAAITGALENAWAKQTDAPLTYVAGDKALASGASFYAKSRPYAVIENSLALTPWVKPENLTQAGLAAVCFEGQEACERALDGFPVTFEEPETVTIEGEGGKHWTVRLFIATPAS
jgi:4-amino-4-deoxy-L-arabinose transferase-like glycosyltransferase